MLGKKVLLPLVVAVISILPLVSFAAAFYQIAIEPSNVVPINTVVTAVATTDDADVERVVFNWFEPDGDLRRGPIIDTEAPFEDSCKLDELGKWTVEATFESNDKDWKEEGYAWAVIFVIPEVPLGTMMAMIASFAALAALTTRRRL